MSVCVVPQQQEQARELYEWCVCQDGRIRVMIITGRGQEIQVRSYKHQITGEDMVFPDMRTASRLCSLLNALS